MGQGGLLLAIVLLGVRFRDDGYHPVMVFSGVVLLSLGAGIILAGVIALGRNLTPFPKPSEKARLIRLAIRMVFILGVFS